MCPYRSVHRVKIFLTARVFISVAMSTTNAKEEFSDWYSGWQRYCSLHYAVCTLSGCMFSNKVDMKRDQIFYLWNSSLPWLKFLSDTLILLTLVVVFSSFFIRGKILSVLIYEKNLFIEPKRSEIFISRWMRWPSKFTLPLSEVSANKSLPSKSS